MKCIVQVVAGVVALLLPGTVSAALALNFVGPVQGRCILPTPGRQAVDLVFSADAASEEDNEGLFAYDLALTVPEAARGKFVLEGAEQPARNFVLDVPGGATFSLAESTPNSLLIYVSSNNNLANIRNGMRAARVFFSISDPTLWALTPVEVLRFDEGATIFGSGDPNRDLVIPVGLGEGLVVCPEPAGLALFAIASVLSLRRRRRV